MNAGGTTADAGATGRATARAAVLLIDDEETLLTVLKLGLEREFDVETATSAEEGARKMDERDFDVVICDLRMPGTSGADFLVAASLRHPRTRRILLTGYVNPDILAKTAAEAGLVACLTKPLKIQLLAQAVRAAVGGK